MVVLLPLIEIIVAVPDCLINSKQNKTTYYSKKYWTKFSGNDGKVVLSSKQCAPNRQEKKRHKQEKALDSDRKTNQKKCYCEKSK